MRRHHKSKFSEKRTKGRHGNKGDRRYFHDRGHHKGSSRRKGLPIHNLIDFIKSGEGRHIKRNGIGHNLKSDITLMTDQVQDKTFMHNTGLNLSVDLERCVRCGKCEKVCPNGAIMVNNDIFRVDSSLCNACGRCVDRCKEAALSLTEN